MIVSLVEKCEIDLFIPEMQMVFIGHDDFGFIVLSETNNPFLKDLALLIANNQLYLLNEKTDEERNGKAGKRHCC